MKRNCIFAAVAALILWIVGREALAQPVRVPDDAVASVTLENGQYLCNFGERLTRTKPLRVIRKGVGPGFVAHRPTATDPHGQTINLTLHGFAMRDWIFVAASGGRYEPSALYNAGVEEVTIENVVVDAPCSVAKAIWTTVDLWGIPVPHGPTLSGGHIVSMRLYGSGGVGFLAVGEVTDVLFGQLSTSGTGPARIQAHTVPQYQWPQWSPAGQPKKPLATSEGMPKRLFVQDARLAEGSYETGIIYSKQLPNLTQPPTMTVAMGGPFPFQAKVVRLGNIGGGGPTDPPPTTTGSYVPAPTWGLDVPTNGPANKTVSGVSFPSTASAGDIIEVSGGPYVGSIGYIPFTAQGTRERPIVIRGVNRPRFNQKLFLYNCKFVIVENIDFHKVEMGCEWRRDANNVPYAVPNSGCNNVVVRNYRVGDDPSRKGGGVSITGGPGAACTDIVITNGEISECGDWQANFDQDIHGISVGAHVSNLWVTGNKISHCSGDAIQINAGSLANQPTLHHVYVYNNEMLECKQTGGATKQARHAVFAGNYVHDMRPIGTSPSAWGAGFGHQYGAGPIWFVANRIEKCSFGIQSGSTSGLGDGQDAYYIFNSFANIKHDSAYAYNPGTAWSNAALSLVGNPNKYAIGNSINAADGGIYFPGGTRILVEGNSIANVLNHDIWLEDPNGNQAFNVLSNLAWQTAKLRRANQPLPWPIGNIVADPATAGRTWIPSPEAVAIFDKYQAEFGVDLRAFKGTSPWKVGAE